MLDGQTRHVAHQRLDREFRDFETERIHATSYLRRKDAIGSVNHEARGLVSSRYSDAHANLNHDAMDMKAALARGDDAPPQCDACHRVRALISAARFCDTRSQYRPLLNWIMDPEFLQ